MTNFNDENEKSKEEIADTEQTGEGTPAPNDEHTRATDGSVGGDTADDLAAADTTQEQTGTADTAADSDEEQTNTENEKESKELKPRRRKIIKNNPFPILIAMVLILAVCLVVWKFFIDSTIVGTWYFLDEYEAVETYDSAYVDDETGEVVETVDSATVTYTPRVVFEFREDNVCVETQGTTSIYYYYTLTEDDDGNDLVAIYTFDSDGEMSYSGFYYEIHGNKLTGRTLVFSTDSFEQELQEGEGESPLEYFDDFTGDDELYGDWVNEEYGITYTFDESGFMTYYYEGYLYIEFAYTVSGDNVLAVRYYSEDEVTDAYVYYVDGDTLTLGSLELTRVTGE